MTAEQLLSILVTVIIAIATATWVLANRINGVKTSVTLQIAEIKTDLAVLKKSEESRDEKINRMWEWWMQALENGWTSHMRGMREKGE